MNVVKRMMTRQRPEEHPPSASSQDNALGLMHLRRLFLEMTTTSRPVTQKEQEEKLYMMLPLFNKVFGEAPPSSMAERFSDLLQFATQVSRLMVTEIRRRASNKSTEAASCAIAQFLEIHQSEESSRGWMLLKTLKLLAASGQKTVDCMTTMSLPSTLVKCLYLFFDLPPPGGPGRATAGGTAAPPAAAAAAATPAGAGAPTPGLANQTDVSCFERRAALQKVFGQILVRLCRFVSPAEELAQKDDLQLVFTALTSWCPAHNLAWRQSAAEALLTLARHGLSANVLKYLHDKECVGLCLQTMRQSSELSLAELLEILVSLLCFLKDSSEVSHSLLDDFRCCQGYQFLCDFMLRLEQAEEEGARDGLRNLVLLVASLSTCGAAELRPSSSLTSGVPYLLPGFTVPQPLGKGMSVRNLQAFGVLQSAFLKAHTTHLCGTILDATSNLFTSDPANFFILESQRPLPQFVERLHAKPARVQERFFQLLESVVFTLDYVPCKELIGVSILLKAGESLGCSVAAVRSLARLLARHPETFREVFRDVGILEALVTCLHRYAALLKDPSQQALGGVGGSGGAYDGTAAGAATAASEDQRELAWLVMDTLTELLHDSNNNAGAFRELGGARCVHNIVRYAECRALALRVVQQLVLSACGDDDMGTLLGFMHTAGPSEITLKSDILAALVEVLTGSHRARTVFRKVGGFVYVTSLLVAMENSLSASPGACWEQADEGEVFGLLRATFRTLTAAMHSEPANARFFAREVQYDKLAEALRLLGCFTGGRQLAGATAALSGCSHDALPQPDTTGPTLPFSSHDALLLPEGGTGCGSGERVSPSLKHCGRLFVYLYHMTTDSFDGSTMNTSSTDIQVVHPGAVLAMVDLLPSIPYEEQPQQALELQLRLAGLLQLLSPGDAAQQVLCRAGLQGALVRRCGPALADEAHPLHAPLQRLFERLASQAIEPAELREFLRLGNPLSCLVWDSRAATVYRLHRLNSSSSSSSDSDGVAARILGDIAECPNGAPGSESPQQQQLQLQRWHRGLLLLLRPPDSVTVPLTRVKCLVSMTTPRDVRSSGSGSTPPFVEFDMAPEGFGCLFLPSLAPQNAQPGSAGGSGSTGDSAVTSGIGTGERLFPPASGLSFSAWFCVERFSPPGRPLHPVRLLTLVRRGVGAELQHACLTVTLSARDRSLVVSTREEPLHGLVEDPAEESSSYEILPSLARFRVAELAQEGVWHHLVLTLGRGVLKNSTATLYLNGQTAGSAKLHYVRSFPGGSANPPAGLSVFGFIGTAPSQRDAGPRLLGAPHLVWRLGPTYLLEEVVTPAAVATIFELGSSYVGSFQAVGASNPKDPKAEGSLGPLVVEERVSLGLNALSESSLTVARIRKVYNRADSKAIAKQLGLLSHENATPIRLLFNTACHLTGPARTIGAALLGYLGVRTFVPRQLASTLQYVGGAAAILGLVAMAADVEGLYAAVKALVCVVKSNPLACKEMERIRGYQLLAMLLKRKRSLLNSHILHLTFSLVGTLDSGRETSLIPNPAGFQDLLCDLEVWLHAPYELHLSLLEHFVELLTESSEATRNARLMREFGLVPRLLLTLRDASLSRASVGAVASVLRLLLQAFPSPGDLLRFGHFLAATLPPHLLSEKALCPDRDEQQQQQQQQDFGWEEEMAGQGGARTVWLRNQLLETLLALLTHGARDKSAVSLTACEDVIRTLGFDWLLLFTQGHLHPSTVLASMRVLLALLSHPSVLARFREGAPGGGWLDHTEPVLTNKIGSVLGINVGRSGGRSSVREINREACHVPGFAVLQAFLPRHTAVPQLYFLLMALLLQQPIARLPGDLKFDLDSIWTFIFGVPASESSGLAPVAPINGICPEAAILLLSMLRSMLNQPWQSEEEGSWLREYPVTLLQFFRYLYHNVADMASLWSSPDFLSALAATLFPLHSRPVSEMSSDFEDILDVGSPADEYKSIVGPDGGGLNRSQSESVSVAGKALLASHPARKIVLDFMRVIVVDNLCLLPASKQTLALDVLLEASPDRSTKAQQKEFQTDLIVGVMEHLLAADVLLGEDASIPLAAGGSYSTLVANTLYVAQRLVDKLWQGMYARDSKQVVDSLLQLITQSKRKAPGLSADILYQCLNRSVLYQLSRPHRTVSQQISLLDALRTLTTQRALIFGAHNPDPEFLGCLVYCLMQLYAGSHPDGFGLEAEGRMTTWHVTLAPELESDRCHGPDTSEGRQLLLKAVRRVWAELMVNRRHAVEDWFRVSLPNSETSGVDITAARSILEEPASKCWQTHLAHEKKLIGRGEAAVGSAVQSKLYRVSSGFALSVLTGGRKYRKEAGAGRAAAPSLQDATGWMFTHVAVVRDLVNFQHRQHVERQQNAQRYVSEEFSQLEGELTRERGLWGPPVGSHLDKWMLDMTEGPCRTRKKMLRNDMFYVHYPYAPDGEPSSPAAASQHRPGKYRRAVSHDSKEFYKRRSACGALESVAPEEAAEVDGVPPDSEQHGGGGGGGGGSDDTIARVRGIVKAPLRRSRSVPDPSEEEGSEGGTEMQGDAVGGESEEKTDNQTVLRLLEEGEKICHLYRCARVQGLDTSEGLLLFGKEHFYVIDGFTVTATREICDIDHLPASEQDAIIPKGSRQGPCQLKRTCSKFAYEDVREVHKRRYLLQPIAIEVFSSDGRNYLLAFPRGIRNKVHQRFLSVVPSLADSSESVSGQRPNTSVEGTGLLSTLWEKSVTQRWERGEISNFQYLMHLNTLAGRSYNDLMQYPVFPWILADYDSEELDLSNPRTFRDLSKPMGAQTEERLAQYRKRYRDWDDPTGETPAYHYGTHYSSAMIVASYLLRMEPFTQTFLRLQGGHFDLADRMFHSVRDAWYSASKHNMADVKELIPEFFYLPEFLLNSNNFDLGCKQNGIKLGDVLLPAWAKGDPREFIRVHRQALECDYVSAHLHEWIDLVFGYKQQGPAAVEAVNVFHHLFYEGQVDIYNINDPLKKTATIGFINNFGQIPKQLFRKPHPPKRVRCRGNGENPGATPTAGGGSGVPDRLFFHHLDNLKPSLAPVKELKEPVGHIVCTDKGVLATEQNRTLLPPQFNRTFSWGYADLSCKLGSYESEKCCVVFECLWEWGHVLCAVCPNPRLVVTGGSSTVVCVWQLEQGGTKERARLTLRQPLYGHTDAVTCLAASPAYHIVVSGSRDQTCCVWDLNKLTFVTQLRGHRAPVSALCINELTGDIVSCAGTHAFVWSINGDPVASVNTCAGGRSQHILCCCVSETSEWDPHNVIVTGHSDGVVRMWRMKFVQVPEIIAQDETRLSERQPLPSTLQPIVTDGADDESSESEGDECSSSADARSNRSASPRQPRGTERHSVPWSTGDAKVPASDEPKRWSQNLSVEESDGYVLVSYGDGASLGRPADPTRSRASSQASSEASPENQALALAQPQPPPETQSPASKLKSGFCWERQLVLCGRLTMHTAFDRKDNAQPAEVTALTISKDQSRVLVGDARGRVFSWAVSESPGRTAADHWVRDEGGDACAACAARFSITERRHHCRNCGQLFCQRCSKYQSEIRRLKLMSPVRVCQACHASLQAERGGGTAGGSGGGGGGGDGGERGRVAT
ncbi:WD repeat and FYVE domain-containing protein 3 isoform X1 [Petromyzon marinus]|uniref:WD repeat and FYVE domain-containing protein 3 isoform X1 n=1 Tax=Petromyzon marinus TaxID=7757 RepID=UPI003F722B09